MGAIDKLIEAARKIPDHLSRYECIWQIKEQLRAMDMESSPYAGGRERNPLVDEECEMKTKLLIEARIFEMQSKLKQAREHSKLAQTGADQAIALQQQARLEGNIGALEWVLREN